MTAGGTAGQEEKQSPQHSMQISRQSADSQQASRMPQSRSQGRSQSAHSPEPQQQQQRHESSELQEPHVAQSRTMLHSVRNSQNRQDRMQWTQQSAGEMARGRGPATGGRLTECRDNARAALPRLRETGTHHPGDPETRRVTWSEGLSPGSLDPESLL